MLVDRELNLFREWTNSREGCEVADVRCATKLVLTRRVLERGLAQARHSTRCLALNTSCLWKRKYSPEEENSRVNILHQIFDSARSRWHCARGRGKREQQARWHASSRATSLAALPILIPGPELYWCAGCAG